MKGKLILESRGGWKTALPFVLAAVAAVLADLPTARHLPDAGAFARSALLAALTAVGAFIKIPLGVSSITLQFFFTAMAGCLLGPYWGAASQGVYVLLGVVGLPIFTQGGGFGYVLQPTFGFLLGLIPSALVMGLLTKKSRRPLRVVLACVAGLAVLYAVGLPYMALILNVYLGKGWSFARLLRDGMLIFLPGDALKIAVAAVLFPKLSVFFDKKQ